MVLQKRSTKFIPQTSTEKSYTHVRATALPENFQSTTGSRKDEILENRKFINSLPELQIDNIFHTILTDKLILEASFGEIRSDTTEAYQGTLSDPRFGASPANNNICGSCASNRDFCPFHIGHIALAHPIINPAGLMASVILVLQSVCNSCGRLLMYPEQLIDAGENMLQGKERLERIAAKVPIKAVCNHCGDNITQFVKDRSNNTGRLYVNGDVPMMIDEYEVKKRLSRISKTDAEFLGFSEYHPSDMVISIYPVIAPEFRPPFYKDNVEHRHVITEIYIKLIRSNGALRNIVEGSKASTKEKTRELINDKITEIIFDIRKFLSSKNWKVNRKNLKSLKSVFGEKGGAIDAIKGSSRMGNVGRTVAGPDPANNHNEITIPEYIARRISTLVVASYHNIEMLTKMYNDGLIKRIIFSKNHVHNHPMVVNDIIITEKNHHLYNIQIGDSVYRPLIDGDIVLIGRQPSLHKGSLIGCRVRITHDINMGANLSITTPLNLDFDGDELNITVIANSGEEMDLIANAKYVMMKEQTGAPLVGIVFNALTAIYLMTAPDDGHHRSWLSSAMFFNGLMEIEHGVNINDLLTRADNENVKLIITFDDGFNDIHLKSDDFRDETNLKNFADTLTPMVSDDIINAKIYNSVDEQINTYIQEIKNTILINDVSSKIGNNINEIHEHIMSLFMNFIDKIKNHEPINELEFIRNINKDQNLLANDLNIINFLMKEFDIDELVLSNVFIQIKNEFEKINTYVDETTDSAEIANREKQMYNLSATQQLKNNNTNIIKSPTDIDLLIFSEQLKSQNLDLFNNKELFESIVKKINTIKKYSQNNIKSWTDVKNILSSLNSTTILSDNSIFLHDNFSTEQYAMIIATKIINIVKLLESPISIKENSVDIIEARKLYERIKSKFTIYYPGSLLLSAVFPSDFNYNMKDVLIRNGIIVQGTLTSTHISPGSHNSIIHFIYTYYNEDRRIEFLSDIQRIGTFIIGSLGVSFGYSDLNTSELQGVNASEELRSAMAAAKYSAQQLASQNQSFQTTKTHEKIAMISSTIVNKAIDIAKKLPSDSPYKIMAESGTKGSAGNTAQALAAIGYISGGKVIGHKWGSARRFPHLFPQSEQMDQFNLIRNGLAINDYTSGFTLTEGFSASDAARKANIAIACNTSESGTIYKNMANAMRSLVIDYLGVVRNERNKINSFLYAGDGMGRNKVLVIQNKDIPPQLISPLPIFADIRNIVDDLNVRA